MSKTTKKTKITSVKAAPVRSVQPVSATPTRSIVPEAKAPSSGSNRVCLELVKPEAKHVCVAGSFNQWRPETTPLSPAGNGRWIGNLSVQPGRHEYLFVVDGQWLPDPNARESVTNPFGGKNSVLVVSA